MQTKEKEAELALLFSGRLIRSRSLLHAAELLAEQIQKRPRAEFDARDLDSLCALVVAACSECDALLEQIDYRA